LFAATSGDTLLAIDVATATVVSNVTTDPTPDTVSTPSLAVAAVGTIYQTDSSDNALRVLYVGDPNNRPPVVATPVVGSPDGRTGVVAGKVVATDPDGDSLIYTVTQKPAYGSVVVHGDGTLTYTPSLVYRLSVTQDHFIVGISDGQGRVLSTVTYAVTVAVLPTDATLKTGTYTLEPPGITSYVGSSAEYTGRKLMEFPVDPAKVRVHIATFNQFEDQMVKGGSLDDISLWIGEAAVGDDGKPTGAFVPGTQVQIPIASTLASGQWGTSDWPVDGKDFNFDPDKQYMFSYGFGTPGGNLANSSGGGSVGWASREAGDAGLDAPALKASTAAHLDVWFEYQYADKGQPSVFVVSNSSAYNLSGATGTRGELDTWVNQWADTYHGVIAGNSLYPAPGQRHSTMA
jgi:methyl coenzyme M reductase subunit D